MSENVKFLKIMKLALQISTQSNVDVFVEYSPHIDGISVRTYDNGWTGEDGEEPDYNHTAYMSIMHYRINEVIDYLEQLKREVIK